MRKLNKVICEICGEARGGKRDHTKCSIKRKELHAQEQAGNKKKRAYSKRDTDFFLKAAGHDQS